MPSNQVTVQVQVQVSAPAPAPVVEEVVPREIRMIRRILKKRRYRTKPIKYEEELGDYDLASYNNDDNDYDI